MVDHLVRLRATHRPAATDSWQRIESWRGPAREAPIAPQSRPWGARIDGSSDDFENLTDREGRFSG